EDRLGRVRTNLHLVRTELQTAAQLCEGHEIAPPAAVARVESIAIVFVGELHAVHDLLYRPQQAPDEAVLEMILASLAAVFRELARDGQDIDRDERLRQARTDLLALLVRVEAARRDRAATPVERRRQIEKPRSLDDAHAKLCGRPEVDDRIGRRIRQRLADARHGDRQRFLRVRDTSRHKSGHEGWQQSHVVMTTEWAYGLVQRTGWLQI